MKYFSEKPFKNSAFAVPTMTDISKKQKKYIVLYFIINKLSTLPYKQQIKLLKY